MGYGVKLEVWGNYALFSRPELRVERVSYDVITPSAARGILEAILWKPAIRYVIDKIYVLSPIKFASVRRNEVSDKIAASALRTAMESPQNAKPLYLSTSESIAQRASLLLQDVHYVIEAHFEMTEKAGEGDSEEKFYCMLRRRIQNGQCYHQPYFGCREFPVFFALNEDDEIETAYMHTSQDLGLMLYDMDYGKADNIQPMFFRAIMQNGVLNLKDCEVFR